MPNTSRFARCVPIILKHEGGYVDHPRDPGGATNMGITHITLARWRDAVVTKDDVRNLTELEAREIYRAWFWNVVQGDALSAGVDLAVFDFAVNSGTVRAARFLQRIVLAHPDGVIGPRTLARVRLYTPRDLINNLCDERMIFLRSLSTWDTFGRGWSNRVTDVRQKALTML